MSKFFYYGFGGKIFHGEDVEIAVENLSFGRIKETSPIRLYRDGQGFYEFVEGCTCFIISDKVKASKIRMIKEKYIKYLKGPFAQLFSEYDDEYQVRGSIPLSMIVGIGLPMDQLKCYDWEEIPYYKSQLQELLTFVKDLKIDIVNTDSLICLRDYNERQGFLEHPIYDYSLERIVDGNFCSRYYYHGLGKIRDSLYYLLSILTTGGIKSKRLLGYESFYGYNGADYVSVCKKYPKGEYRQNRMNAFYSYVMDSFCLILSDSIPAFKLSPDYIRPNIFDKVIDRRVSDMFDEWQVKDQIPLSSIIGIGIPLKKLKNFMGRLVKEDFETLRKIVLLAKELGLDIVDSSHPKFVEKYEASKKEKPNKIYQVKIDMFDGYQK